MNTETTMSPAEILVLLDRLRYSLQDFRGVVGDIKRARTAVAALVEREAALVAERDAAHGIARSAVLEVAAVKAERDALAERVKAQYHDGYNNAIRFVLGCFNGVGDCGSTAYEEILRECGSVEIIRSAVQQGEMEFTGLDSWVEENGTPEERDAARAEARNG